MKKVLRCSFIKFPLPFIVFCIALGQVVFAQDCKTQAASKPSIMTRGTDAVETGTGKMNAAEMTKMKVYLAKAESWTKKLLTNFTGAKLLYYNNFFPKYLPDPENTDNMFLAVGTKGHYSGKMMFFAYYCYDNSNTIHTEVESGSTINVQFNNVFAFGFSEDGASSINGRKAFKIIQKKKTEGRIDFYEQRTQHNATGKMFTPNDYIIFRNSDNPVFIRVTRKDYLQQMLIDGDAFGNKDAKLMNQSYAQNAKQFEEEMRVYKAMDKSYTPEKEAKRRKWFEEDQAKLKNQISKSSPETDAGKAVLLQYLKKPAEWLNKGVGDFYPFSTYSAGAVTQYLENLDKSFSNGEEETATEIVTINPAYFNKTLSSDVPQVIMVHLRNGTYAHMQKVDALVKKTGALAPLEAILNPAKSAPMDVTAPEIVSIYSLQYLSKLTSLTPLIVPKGMKPSVIPVTSNYNNAAPAASSNFSVPPVSAKLSQLPQLVTAENYTAYIKQLHTAIAAAIKPDQKRKEDDYLKNKKITDSKQLGSRAFSAWLKNSPSASLYLYSLALVSNPSDALTANNFAAFLIMGGLADKAIPLLEYWNRQKPGEPSILSNLGNAYYRLGNVDKAINYLKQSVQKDSLQPIANKILCMIYLKRGDTKSAKDHGTRSLTGSYDEQVIALLRQLDNKITPGGIMSRWPVKEFPMLKRVKLPAMPQRLDDMQKFNIELAAEKKSMEITIADIESKLSGVSEDLQQKVLMASLKGLSPLRMKAQYIIMEAMQRYLREMISETDVFKYNMQQVTAPFSAKVKTITKKYGDQLNKLEGGEAGDEDKITSLELARCNEINTEKEKYLGDLSTLVNFYAQRKEYISRKFYAEYANWAPYWMPETTISFPAIEKDYLKDMLGILSEYTNISKNDCTPTEPLADKDGKLKVWEDEFYANFKGEIYMGAASISWDCNSWKVEGGEGIVGELEVNYSDDGSFEDFTVGAGPGVSWDLAGGGIAKIEAGASVREFIKIGSNKATGDWEVKDFRLKADAGVQGNVGPIKAEIKIVELSASVTAGINVGGGIPAILNLK